MEQYALLLAATLNAGTVLAIAALGLLINEKSGIVNLGAEGLMLCAAVAGFATVVHTGNDWLGFAAGMGSGALLAAVFGVLVIWLNTNQYATGLALSLFGVGFSAFAGIGYVQEKLPERAQFAVPFLSDIPWLGSALFKQHPMVYLAMALAAGIGVVFIPFAHRFGAAQRGRKPRRRPRFGLSGAAHPPGCRGGGRRAVRAGRGLPCGHLHAAVGRGHGGWQGLDRAGPHDLCHLAPGTGIAW